MNITVTSKTRTGQQGAILIVSMLLLLVMTLLGITAVSTSTLEEKMASNNRQRQLAFQSASSALRDAETWLRTTVSSVAQFEVRFNGTPDELYWVRQPTPGDQVRAVPMDIYDGYAWTVGNSQQPATSVTNAANTPRYVIEYMGRIGEPPLDYTEPDNRNYAFRVTAIGWGTDNTTTFVTQSAFRIPLI
jgi:type IV pilus assembly protein PilX